MIVKPAQTSRQLFINLVVVSVFVGLMVSAITYFYRSDPDLNEVAMNSIQDRFTKSVIGAHWQWVREGEPSRLMLVHYDRAGREVDRTPLAMSHLGWPRVEPGAEGCEKLWTGILNLPLHINQLKVHAEYFDGAKLRGNALESACRFRVTMGPAFEYRIYTGQVSKLKNNIFGVPE